MSKATVALGAVIATLGIAGVVVASVALVKVQQASSTTTTTVTATPESATAPDHVHAAAIEACAAAETFRSAVGAVRKPYLEATKSSPDWNTAEFVALEGRYFGGVAAELSYLRSHTSAETPERISDAIGDVIRTAAELVNVDVLRLPGAVSDDALGRLRAADKSVSDACDAEGAGK
jgi:hypothetical protein